jgi:site-specific DNA recombinase
MLCNERYVGRVTWNHPSWMQVPGRKSRRRVPRPEAEWVIQTNPELALVSQELWDAAQARLQRVHAHARGRPAGTGKHVYLVSGLLRCGVCGGSMTVIGRKEKAGVSYARFGCTAHTSRGSSICANALSVSEKKASRTLINALREKLGRPELVERFVATFKRRVNERRAAAAATTDPSRSVRESERRIANLTEAVAKVG